jgi:hypothetical protein
MSTNTALVTDTAKQAAQQTLANYASGVFSHINGDFGKHNQVKVYAQSFTDKSVGGVVAFNSLRMMLTLNTTNTVVIIPCTSSGTVVIGNALPIITLQPASITRAPGGTGTFSVSAISDSALRYQWRKNGVNIANATSEKLVFTGITTADAATYSCLVSNANGSRTSNNATLTVQAGASGGGDDGFDFFDLPHFAPFHLFGLF